MAKRGPKPKSAARRAIDGSRARPAAPGPVATADPQAPPRPDFLSAVALARWDELVPELVRLRTVTSIDGDTLASYCQTWADYLSAVAEIAKTGLLVRRGTGALFANPAVGVARQAQVQLARLGASLGLTPESRARLNIATTDPMDDDPLGRFLAGKD